MSPFLYSARMWQTDGRTDRQTPRQWLRRAMHYMLSRVKTKKNFSALAASPLNRRQRFYNLAFRSRRGVAPHFEAPSAAYEVRQQWRVKAAFDLQWSDNSATVGRIKSSTVCLWESLFFLPNRQLQLLHHEKLPMNSAFISGLMYNKAHVGLPRSVQ